MSDQDESAILPPATPRSSLGSGALSYSSGSSVSPSTSSSGSGSAKTAISECLGAWLNYLQVLNNLCQSGYRLAQTISTLEQWANQEQTGFHGFIQPGMMPSAAAPNQSQLTFQITTAWDDLQRATTVATNTVKSHVISVLQDFITQPLNTFEQESDVQRVRDRNQQIVAENAQTMINIQHQFCMASCDSFSSLMCCLVCQAPIGFPHDTDCAMIQHQQQQQQQQQQQNYIKLSGTDPRSQTPSPHFGTTGLMKLPSDIRGSMYDRGSGSTHSSDHGCALTGTAIEHTRGPSPHSDIRGPSPIQGFLDNIRGPLPNPGHLLGMKAPFYRGSRSPLNFPLFPLNGQRRWSEAAAGQVSDETGLDADNQMRRWSMPWEASKTDRNTVAWHQTKITPISKLAVPHSISKSGSDRSTSTTPDSVWQSSVTSQDGLAEAIQLLSCRPTNRMFQHPSVQPSIIGAFIEEPHTSSQSPHGTYTIWGAPKKNDRLPPFIQFHKDQDKSSFDENQ